jgi:hypothetical protein
MSPQPSGSVEIGPEPQRPRRISSAHRPKLSLSSATVSLFYRSMAMDEYESSIGGKGGDLVLCQSVVVWLHGEPMKGGGPELVEPLVTFPPRTPSMSSTCSSTECADASRDRAARETWHPAGLPVLAPLTMRRSGHLVLTIRCRPVSSTSRMVPTSRSG